MQRVKSRFPAVSPVVTAALIMLAGVSPSHGEITADINVGYDAYGHMHQVQSPFGNTRVTEYNYLGKATAVRWRGAQIIDDAVYGEHGRIESFDYAGLAGQAARRADFTYDALERLESMALSTDGVAGFDYLAEALHYDERGFLLGLDRADRAVGSAQVGYGYSPQGQLTSFEWGGSRIDYTYDPRGNLTDRSGALGVPAMASAHYDLSNRRAGWSYDDAGRLLEDETYRYDYDAAGRLRLVLDRHTGSFVAHYLYDASGRRARTLEPDRVTYSLRGSDGIVAEIDYDRALEYEQSREHVTFAGREVLQATYEPDSTELRLQFTDRLGHPVVSWADGGTTVHEVSPYGLPLSVAGAKPHQGAYGFTGHEDDGTGLVYMQARYFDPASARFTRPDPARDWSPLLPATANLYAYAYGNPIAYHDPFGLETEVGGHWENALWAAREAIFNPPPYAKNLRRFGFGLLTIATGGYVMKGAAQALGGSRGAQFWWSFAKYNNGGSRVAAFIDEGLKVLHFGGNGPLARQLFLYGPISVGHGAVKVGEGIYGGTGEPVSFYAALTRPLGVTPNQAGAYEPRLEAALNLLSGASTRDWVVWLSEFWLTGNYDQEEELKPGVILTIEKLVVEQPAK